MLDPTHYDTLGVARLAEPSVVRAAYKALIQAYHPDRHPGAAAAHTRTLAINAAYAVLGDAAQRKAYDRTLKEGEATHAPDPASSPADGAAHAEAIAAFRAAKRDIERRQQAAATWAEAAERTQRERGFTYTLDNPTDQPMLAQWVDGQGQALATRHLGPGDQVQVRLISMATHMRVAYRPQAEGPGRYAVAGWMTVALEEGSVSLPLPGGAPHIEGQSWAEAWAALGAWRWGAIPLAVVSALVGGWMV